LSSAGWAYQSSFTLYSTMTTSASRGTCMLTHAAMYALVVPGTAPLFTVTLTLATLAYVSLR
jgi:hypothetical protein